MEKSEKRAVIKYFYLKGLTPFQIKEELDPTLKDSSPSYSTIKQWVSEFKKGRTTFRTPCHTTPEMIGKIHMMVMEDRRLKSNREVIDAVNEYFEGLDESHYKNGITALEHRYEKCINFNGEYVEK
ncbi:unnamed protein product [Euphydryas editha]|uniref:Mos1 transposase HTH domain-containing protein n=1 Tax=Euphydryas editha TaxID=104508 RepID=A0AAU9TBP0_EUPED|nr:unnamed protein product [Euphydryas editha]